MVGNMSALKTLILNLLLPDLICASVSDFVCTVIVLPDNLLIMLLDNLKGIRMLPGSLTNTLSPVKTVLTKVRSISEVVKIMFSSVATIFTDSKVLIVGLLPIAMPMSFMSFLNVFVSILISIAIYPFCFF
ncbi:hypothetical protein FC36_GL001165 [Ligilactobacillus equi DSM 15833 = JCM 10991]|uniref:Uncharacterized protein n=1 Tax=Ligilactobacillus equi DSM 15833 = JCM 10991 TaxID=1423740 RepID=A0A0R1THC8_9LACO|nr:hypothetical protein FC36_GL001165 [Ligilactobacillus equi DSM 15833 = JCM 10991]